MMRGNSCSKCGGSMTEGFTFRTNHGGQHAVAEWIEGAPQKSFWNGLKLSGRKRINIQTYRCSRCGLLESYARS
ncbi:MULTISPECIES: hypothetical protein [unclassified Sphingomonas]|jgi:S-adenosylmethionine:diacylglycerol 3-amino-3-carboxypropyl transferase|uniref:hypothetical protein n=2 Tax=Sphingomonas TaxID=13687 RepID=UPI000A799B85|nr:MULTISPECIES: hypothetical protein [unclassified Sphingomonas]